MLPDYAPYLPIGKTKLLRKRLVTNSIQPSALQYLPVPLVKDPLVYQVLYL